MRRALARALALAHSHAHATRALGRAAPAAAAAPPPRRCVASAPQPPPAAPPALELADALSVEVLTAASQWRVAAAGDDGGVAPPSRLRKTFELADVRTATRFIAQARDLNLRLARRGAEQLHISVPRAAAAAADSAAAASAAAPAAAAPLYFHVDVRVPRPASASPRGPLTQREVDAALAADAVAAELQFAGKWG